MKHLALSALMALGSFTAINAQTTPKTAVNNTTKVTMTTNEMSDSEFERLIFNSFKINLRTFAYDNLQLTSEQIEDIDPHFMAYMKQKSELINRRQDLVDEFAEEMAEENSQKSENNETAEFIESYWEFDIASLELKKDFYDRFEDIIGYEKATKFFVLEEDLLQRMNRMMLVERVPTYLISPVNRYTENVEVQAYNRWMMDIDGKVNVSHEYTHDGLTQLVKVAGSLKEAAGIDWPSYDKHRQKVMMLGDDITENWKEVDHADKARKAFMTVATMFSELSQTNAFMTNSYLIDELMMTAKKLDGSKMMTDQADVVYNFFEKAERVVNKLAKTADERVTNQFMRTRR